MMIEKQYAKIRSRQSWRQVVASVWSYVMHAEILNYDK